MAPHEIESFDLELPHGIRLACRSCGEPGLPRLMFLHGFPEGNFIWDPVMQALAEASHGVAPNLRGYGDSSAPPGVEAYRLPLLIADLVAAIETIGAPLAALVAHDWGGTLAWQLAAQRPDLIERLVILNAPHPVMLQRELLRNPEQQQASAYMNWLCRPDAAARLAANDYERLFAMFGRSADGASPAPAWLDERMRGHYRALWSRGLEGPLNYYRASPLRPHDGAGTPAAALKLDPQRLQVPVPTLVLWGRRDIALRPGLVDGLEAVVPQLQLQWLPDASHWVVQEQPLQVADAIRGFVGLGG